jgi:hypothetical protein
MEQHIGTTASSFQPHENRVIRAATLFAQGARLLHEESFDLLNIRHAARLRVISDSVQRLVSALSAAPIQPPLLAPQRSVDPKDRSKL